MTTTTLMTQAFLLEKYGPRLSMDQVAEVLNMHRATAFSLMARGEFPIKTYKEGKRRFASYQAVAEYLDSMALLAKTKAGS